MKSVQFLPNSDRSNFTLQQDSILQTISAGLIKANLVIAQKDKKVSIISLTVKTENELFLIGFALTYNALLKIINDNILIDNCQFEGLYFDVRSNYDTNHIVIQNNSFKYSTYGIAFSTTTDVVATTGPTYARIVNNKFQNGIHCLVSRFGINDRTMTKTEQSITNKQFQNGKYRTNNNLFSRKFHFGIDRYIILPERVF